MTSQIFPTYIFYHQEIHIFDRLIVSLIICNSDHILYEICIIFSIRCPKGALKIINNIDNIIDYID